MPDFRLRRCLVATLILLCIQPGYADVLDDILQRGSLRVGVAEFVPWTMKNESGGLTGFEIDVATKLAADMGVTPEFRVYEWDAIIPALRKGEIDIISGGMAITPQRALQVNFSRPLATSGVGLALNTRLTRNVKTLSALNQANVTLVVVTDTFAAGVANTLFDRAQVRAFPNPALAEAEVLEGRAHGYVAGMSEATFLMLQHKDTVDVPVSEPLVAASEAWAVRKGEQEFLNFLNAWVTAHQSDKWLPTTRDYWFTTLDWADTVKGE